MGVTRTHLPLFLEPQSKYLSGGASSSATLLRRAISKGILCAGWYERQASGNKLNAPPVTSHEMEDAIDNKTAVCVTGYNQQPSIS
jgi:hypothetical protein